MDPKIAKNVLMFLERTPVTGMESFAFCEAVVSLQCEIAGPSAPQSPEPDDDTPNSADDVAIEPPTSATDGAPSNVVDIFRAA